MAQYLEFEFSNTGKEKLGRKKIFLITFIAVFIIVLLQQLGVKAPPILLTPTPVKADLFEVLRPKLQKKKNDYKLQKPQSLITQLFAAPAAENAASYVVVDYQNGNILAEKASKNKLPIASLTKIMTAVIAIDIFSPSNIFTVTKEATRVQPTNMGVTEGEKLTLEELLNASLLTSANDATEVIHQEVDNIYGKGTFIKAMNLKARMIGLHNTNFTNPQGYDIDNNYSSAQDVAVLTYYALTHYPLIAQIAKRELYEIPETIDHKRFILPNWNGLLGVYPNILGVKIGNTAAAGMTTSVLAEREEKKILVILLGAPGIIERDLWTSQLLDIGYELSLNLEPIEVSQYNLQQKYATWQYL